MGTKPFRKPTTTFARLVRDAAALLPRAGSVAAVWGARRLDPSLRELLMVEVARANSCRHCAFTHEAWARATGVEEGVLAGEGRDRRTELAVSLARAFGAAGSPGPSDALEQQAAEVWSPDERRHIETVARAIAVANLTGNTWDALLARLHGSPAPGSHLADELAVSVFYALAAPPVALWLSAMGLRSPLDVLRDFRSFSERFEVERGD